MINIFLKCEFQKFVKHGSQLNIGLINDLEITRETLRVLQKGSILLFEK